MSDEYSYLYTDPNAPTTPYTGDDPYVLARLKANSGSGTSWLDKLSVNTGIKSPELPKLSSTLPAVGDINKAFGDAAGKVASISGINVADVSSMANKVSAGIKTLSSGQVSGLIAQVSKNVPQSAAAMSNELGVGKFGLSPAQLEKSGHLKPGTVENLIRTTNKSLTDVLGSASNWTGKDGIKNVNTLLNNETLQNNVQADMWKSGFDDLLTKGAISGKEDPAKLSGMLTTASKFGVDTAVDWVKGKLPGDIKGEVDKLAKSSQMAVNLVDQKVPAQVKDVLVPPLAKNTTNRAAIDQALGKLIGNPKIATPSFAPPAASDLLGADSGWSTLVTTVSSLPVNTATISSASIDSPFGDLVSIPSAPTEDKHPYVSKLDEAIAAGKVPPGGIAADRKRRIAQACGCSESQLISIGKSFGGPIWACPNGTMPVY